MPVLYNSTVEFLVASSSRASVDSLSTLASFGMNLLTLLTALVPATAVAAASWSASPFVPHSVPLAVRSPYLSAWLPQGEGTALNEAWPQFWTGSVCNLSSH